MAAPRGIAIACLGLAVMAAPPVFAEEGFAPAEVSFYFAAHEDDWQLFMNPAAFEDVAKEKTKTVFVHVTAGDAGLGMGTGGRRHPLYRARENGADTAIRFMATRDYETPCEKVVARLNFNGHVIERASYRNAVAYFLRLPDGNPAGTGYAQTGFQSLKRLATGANDKLAAIDGSAVYRGWSDLVATLRAIIDFERGQAATVKLNVPELDPAINPDDHSDHLMTARAALDAAGDLTCARRLHYVNYASARLPENLTAQQRDMESSVFAVTLAGVLALDHTVAWHRYDRSYVGRSYFRVEENAGTCAPAALVSAGSSPPAAPIQTASAPRTGR